MNDYWLPSSKWQLSAWLSDYYNIPRKKFQQMKRNQLYAIYHKTRQKLEKERGLLNEAIGY